jgi:hypothetical protein
MSFHPETETYKYWTIEEDLKLESLAQSNSMSYKEIGKILNRSGSSCQSRASNLGIRNKYNEITSKKYLVNENFWATPNEINCYWAGFSAADANIQIRKNGHFSYRLEIQKSDKSHLQKLIQDCSFDGKIYESNRVVKNSKNLSETIRICVHSDIWAENLKNIFGITPNKTSVVMPPILNQELLIRWLIGYTDGDGTIYLGNNQRTIYISYTSCNPKLIKWIKNYFDDFGNQLKNKPNSVSIYNNKYFKISIGGLKAAQFIDHVNSLNTYCLARKWQNPAILSVIDSYKQKYPQFFIKN